MTLRPSIAPQRSTAASALVAELVDFAAACGLDFTTCLVAESASESVCSPSVGGECALGTDVLEDRQEEFECFSAAVPHLVSMLIAREGDPDAPDILTPRSYAEAIEGPYSSQWQAAMDPEMASWKSTGTYVDEVPLPGENIVSGMWIFKRDYELHSLDFSTAFLQGSLHEEIRLRRPPGFTGSFPAGTQWSLRRPVYGLCQAPREWHDTLRTILAALGGYPLSLLARYVAPGRHQKVQWDAAKRVLRYLCSMSGMGLVLGGRARVVLTGHANASWVDDLATQRSSQGYTFSLGSGSVSWRSTRSSYVLSSSCEAEIYAGAMAAQERRWLIYLLTDLGEAPRSPPVLYQGGQLRLAYVASQANTADVFTKAVQPYDHQPCFAFLDWSFARYSSPATAALGRLILPYLFPELSAFATVEDLVTNLRTSDARYRAALPAEILVKNQPPIYITLYFIVTRLPNSLRAVRDYFLALDPTDLTVDLLEQHLLAAETSVVTVGAACGTPRMPFFEGMLGLLLLVGSAVAARARVAVLVEVAVGVVVGAAVEVVEVVEVLTAEGLVAGLGALVAAVVAAVGVAVVAAVGVVAVGVELFRGEVQAVASGCSISVGARPLRPNSFSALPGTTSSEALHTFTLDSGASRCFFRDRTTLTPLSAPVPVRLADPSGGPVLARSSTFLPCPAVLSGSLGQRVSICPCTRTGRHLATFTRRPGWNLYTLATEPPQVAASGRVAPPCSCCLLLHHTLLWHHRLGHSSLPRLRVMQSRLLVSGLPRFLPPLPPLPTLPYLPVLRLHSVRGGAFSSNLLQEFCCGEGILQLFTLPACPQQHGIAECRIPEGWLCHGGRSYLHNPCGCSPICVAVCGPEVTFDESVTFYRLSPYHSAPLPPPPLFLALGPPLVDPPPPLRIHKHLRFSQGQGVDFFQTFSPTPKMTTRWVLLHVPAQRDYELQSLDSSTTFLRGSLHEEIWLRCQPSFTGSFPAGAQLSLRRPVNGLRQEPREWHDTLRTTLAALRFALSTANPSLFLRTDTSLPPLYVLVYVDDLVFASADTEALALVKSELQKRHTDIDMGVTTTQQQVGLEVKGWHVKHMDITTAFLNGVLLEEIYMAQPDDYEDGTNWVCKLKKAIYGLKQVPKCWYEKLEEVLLGGGFKTSQADHSLFLLGEGEQFLLLLVYVDDILLFSFSMEQIERTQKLLMDNFKCKMLGDVHHYLGLQIERDVERRWLKVHQSHYISGVMERYGVTGDRTVMTPFPAVFKLKKAAEEDDVLEDEQQNENQSLIGSVMYAALHTRPHASFGVGKLARVVQQLEMAKRLVRYLESKASAGVQF
ncbi:unnamed protein product [Closterium sp. NIES-53]